MQIRFLAGAAGLGVRIVLALHSRPSLCIRVLSGVACWPLSNWRRRDRRSLGLTCLILGIVLRRLVAREPVDFPDSAMRASIMTDQMQRHDRK